MSIDLNELKLTFARERDPKIFGYNIEMAELIGGMFWKPYTPEQVAGTEEFPPIVPTDDLNEIMGRMMSVFPPVNLYNERLRTLAKGLGPAVVRYSGGWASSLYFDSDDTAGGKAPEGFASVLTREQWQGALDFAKAADADIMVSVANCEGTHREGYTDWLPNEAKKLWDYTASQGMSIKYAEFMNEPNIRFGSTLPKEYGSKEFAADHDAFARWLKAEHPETELIGPCNAKGPRLVGPSAQMMLPCEDMLEAMEIKPTGYSYHSYTGVSERGALLGHHYDFSEALNEDYLDATMVDLDYNSKIRDTYMPEARMWVTESGCAGSGGNTWGPTFIEVIRLLDELCKFAKKADGVILHNTLCAGAYALIDEETGMPRPQYWGAYLYKKLMGLTVYETGEKIREGCHLYAQSRADGKEGVCWLYINNSWDESAYVSVPDCELYQLTGPAPRSTETYLNGRLIAMPEDPGQMPELDPVSIKAGTIEIPPCSVAFIVTD